MLHSEAEKWVVLAVIGIVLVLLFIDRIRASFVFFGGVLILLLAGIVEIPTFLSSFSNESVLAIFLLIIITAVFKNNFNLIGLMDRLFRSAKSTRGFTFRMTSGVAIISAIMNNTPIVALMIPYVYQWGKKHNVSPSKLLIPLSYAAITGGVITVIGTSTNLVLNGFLQANAEPVLTTLDFVGPGLLVSLAGVLFLATIGYRLLPQTAEVMDRVRQNIREYLAETRLDSGSPLVGQTIQQAGLRNLDGIFLVEILRNGEQIKPVEPDERLYAEDRLYFAGETHRVINLVERFPGLTWAKTDRFQLGDKLEIVETVIPRNSRLIGKTLKQVEFREKYDAAVVAIHRNGERLTGKIGEIQLETGDLLLLTTGKRFLRKNARDKNMYIVSSLSKIDGTLSRKKRWFLFAFTALVAAMIAGVIPFFLGLVLIVSIIGGLGMMTSEEFKKHINLDLLIVLGSALTIGSVFIETGTAEMIAAPFISLFSPYGAVGLVIGLYLLTFLLTSFITNVAAVSIAFPLAYQLIEDAQLNPTPVYLLLAFAASAAFITPASYQTNLMVYGPGSYRFKDFLRIGLPFTLLYSLLSITFILNRYSLDG